MFLLVLTLLESKGKEIEIWTDPEGYEGPYHYGGSIAFDPHGHVYLSMGDKWDDASKTQQLDNTVGKVMRFYQDGTFPLDNVGQTSSSYHDGIWAYGVRNGEQTTYCLDICTRKPASPIICPCAGFRSVWDNEHQRLLVAVVGGNNWAKGHEDLHALKGGENLGWPLCEGGLSFFF